MKKNRSIKSNYSFHKGGDIANILIYDVNPLSKFYFLTTRGFHINEIHYKNKMYITDFGKHKSYKDAKRNMLTYFSRFDNITSQQEENKHDS